MKPTSEGKAENVRTRIEPHHVIVVEQRTC